MPTAADFTEALKAVSEDNTLSQGEKADYIQKIRDKQLQTIAPDKAQPGQSAFSNSLPQAQPAPSSQRDWLPPEPEKPPSGMQNLLGTAYGGIQKGFEGIGNVIQNPAPLLGQIGHAFQTEATSSYGPATGLGAGALLGTASLANGLLGLPAALQNAWQGQETVQPSIQIPTGGLEGFVEKNVPVSGFVGQAAPYIATDAALPAILSKLGPAGNLINAGMNKLPELARAAATGAGYGVLGTPGNLEQRFEGAVNNAALGAGLHLGGNLLGKVGWSGAEGAPTAFDNLKEMRGQDVANGAPETSFQAPPHSEEVSGQIVHDPFLSEQQQDELKLDPITGQPTQPPQAWQSLQSWNPGQPGQSTSRPNLPAQWAEQTPQSLSPEAQARIQQLLQDPNVAPNVKEALQAQIQRMVDLNEQPTSETTAQPAQEAPKAEQPPENDADIQAQREAVLKQQEAQRQADIQAKTDAFYNHLANMEKLGASKKNIETMKQQMAHQATNHPDEGTRQAYQAAVDKYAASKQPIQKGGVSREQVQGQKPEAQPTPEADKTQQATVEASGEKSPSVENPQALDQAQAESPVVEVGTTQEGTQSQGKINKQTIERIHSVLDGSFSGTELGDSIPARDFLEDWYPRGKVESDPQSSQPGALRINVGGKLKWIKFSTKDSIASLFERYPDLKRAIARRISNQGGEQVLLNHINDYQGRGGDVGENATYYGHLEEQGNAQLKIRDKEAPQEELALIEEHKQAIEAIKNASTMQELEAAYENAHDERFGNIPDNVGTDEYWNEVQRTYADAESRIQDEGERLLSGGVQEEVRSGSEGTEGRPGGNEPSDEDIPTPGGVEKQQQLFQAYSVNPEVDKTGARQKTLDFYAEPETITETDSQKLQTSLDALNKIDENKLSPDAKKTIQARKKAIKGKLKVDEPPAEKPLEGQIDQEALDAIYPPEKPEAVKEPVLKGKAEKTETKTESTKEKKSSERQPEHLTSKGPTQAANWADLDETLADPNFQALREKLPPDAQKDLEQAIQAIKNKEKTIGKLYNTVTKTKEGMLEKKAPYDIEVYSPQALGYSKERVNKSGQVTKQAQIYMEGYNEKGMLSKRRFVDEDGNTTFSGSLKHIPEARYEGLYRHPSELKAGKNDIHLPENSVIDQINNIFIKKHRQGKAIGESDYQKGAVLLRNLLDETIEADPTREDAILERVYENIPKPIQDIMDKRC